MFIDKHVLKQLVFFIETFKLVIVICVRNKEENESDEVSLSNKLLLLWIKLLILSIKRWLNEEISL